jgi:intein/homing endonuclease
MNDLAYIKGVMDGDGWIDRGNQHRVGHGICKPRLSLYVVSKKFADTFSEALTHIGLTPRREERDTTRTFEGRTWANHVYMVRATCPECLIQELSSLKIENRDEKIGYIKGFFQSEGTARTQKYPTRTCYSIRMYNKNTTLLAKIKGWLSTLGFIVVLRDYPYHVAFLEIQSKAGYENFLETFGGKQK